MSEVLNSALAACDGLDRWDKLRSIRATFSVSGALFASKGRAGWIFGGTRWPNQFLSRSIYSKSPFNKSPNKTSFTKIRVMKSQQEADKARYHSSPGGLCDRARHSGNGLPAAWIVTDIVRIKDGILFEHWDVIQDEATKEQSKSGNRDVWTYPCEARAQG
jgi:hypothetical protein